MRAGRPFIKASARRFIQHTKSCLNLPVTLKTPIKNIQTYEWTFNSKLTRFCICAEYQGIQLRNISFHAVTFHFCVSLCVLRCFSEQKMSERLLKFPVFTWIQTYSILGFPGVRRMAETLPKWKFNCTHFVKHLWKAFHDFYKIFWDRENLFNL